MPKKGSIAEGESSENQESSEKQRWGIGRECPADARGAADGCGGCDTRRGCGTPDGKVAVAAHPAGRGMVHSALSPRTGAVL